MLSAQTFGLRFRIVLTQARDITPLYASYISEYAIDATTSTHMLYLLKRPLVRIRYLAKVMKKLAENTSRLFGRRIHGPLDRRAGGFSRRL